jgi:UDP-glucose:O-linked fucose beta-1,3-glucosyltransferase
MPPVERVLVVVADAGNPQQSSPGVVMLGELNHRRPGAWTILPVLPTLATMLRPGIDWVFFAPRGTTPAPAEIAAVLSGHDGRRELFLGRAQCDLNPTAIHHYAPQELDYPDAACGFALTSALVTRLSTRWKARAPVARFHIDPTYEFAAFVRDAGVCLTDEPRLAGGPDRSDADILAVAPDAVVFAVKTHAGNHATRLPVVRRTWARDAAHLIFYSDLHDPSVPTVAVDVPNAIRGHGRKLHALLRQLRDAHGDKQWYVIADDDTLISVPRLLRTLGGFSERGDEPLFVGRRYGYGHDLRGGGYDFITLGGGMAVNRSGLQALLAHDPQGPAVDAPDDMWVGRCLQQMGIALQHHEGFHQEPPSAYPACALTHSRPVSFHRHAPDNPYEVYARYLAEPSSA